MRKIRRELEHAFPSATMETTNGNHLRVRLPDGQSVFVASTPGERRTMMNVRSEVRPSMNVKTDRSKTAE